MLSVLIFVAATAFGGPGLGPVRVRLAAANVSSGRHQSYDPGHGARILLAGAPDVTGIQEFNYGDNSASAIREFVDGAFGKGFQYYREENPKWRIPNGIVSRYPIAQSGSWVDHIIPDRGFAWAEIRVPGGRPLYFLSVHLSSKSATNRDIEATALVELIQKNFPADAMIAIAGDFNTKTKGETAIKTLAAVVEEKQAPEDGKGNTMTNAPRNKKYDWVIGSPALNQYQVAVDLRECPLEPEVPGKNIFATGLVFDTRVMDFLPPPALVDDSAAEAMQHMMILKDYALPQ